MTTDTSEKGLERLICAALTGAPCDPPQGGMVAAGRLRRGLDMRRFAGLRPGVLRRPGLTLRLPAATQRNAAESLDLGRDNTTRRKFLARLQGEVAKRGTIDVLRKGVKHGPHQIDLLYGTPSPGNEKASA